MTPAVRILRTLFPVILLLLLAVGAILLFQRLGDRREPLEIVLPAPAAGVVVYVSGAVASPGLYTLEEGARVEEAVKRAGGFATDADVGSINLALKLRDGMQVHVPRVGESFPTPEAKTPPININTATQKELERLKGIGEARARAIIEYREKNGPFERPEDLLRVKGIGPSIFRDIRELVSVE